MNSSELSNEIVYLVFEKKETEEQRDKTTCPKSSSYKMAEPRF